MDNVKIRLSSVLILFMFGLSITLQGVPYKQVIELMVLGAASILAIVVSVGLLSVQLAATEYTPLAVKSDSNYYHILKYFWRFIYAIFVNITSYILISSSTPMFSIGNWTQFGSAILFAVSVGSMSYAILSIPSLFEETLTAIDRDHILSNISSNATFGDVEEYINDRNSGDTTERHPVLVIYTMAKNALEDGDTHAAQESIDHLQEGTENILKGFDRVTPRESTKQDGMKDLFGYWEEIGILSVENEMRTVTRFWLTTFDSVLKCCVLYAPSSVFQRAIDTYQEVIFQVIAKFSLGDNPKLQIQFLELTIKKNRWDIFQTSLSIASSVIQKSISESQARFPAKVERLLDEFFDSWSAAIESNPSSMDIDDTSQEYDTCISDIIEELSNPYELHNIELMRSHSYFVSKLEEVGETATKSESKKAVQIITSIIIDLYVSTRNPKRTGAITRQVKRDRYGEVLATIIEAGGENAVQAAFQELEELPRLELEEGDSKFGAYSDLTTELDDIEGRHFVRFNEFYLGRDVIQDLIKELAEEANINFSTNKKKSAEDT